VKALERAQGYLRLPDGKTVNGFSHRYTPDGTTTLNFWILRIKLVTAQTGGEIRVVLDNLSTHKSKEDRSRALTSTSSPRTHGG